MSSVETLFQDVGIDIGMFEIELPSSELESSTDEAQ